MKNLILLSFLSVCSIGVAQQTEYVDFKTAKVDIIFRDLVKKEIEGLITYEFVVIRDIDSVYLDAKNMEFSKVELREVGVHVDVLHYGIKSKNNSNQIIIYNEFKKGEVYELVLKYAAKPKKALYFIDWKNENRNKQVWTQGQGKYTSNWLPSIDDMNDKIEFDLSITFDSDYEVVANGKLINKRISKSTTTWHYDMQKPMSSYLVALVIGKYDKKVEYSKSGIPLEMYFYPEDSLNVEPTYRYTKQMFDFLEEEIGIPYPWQNYKQVPVKDFLYAGMENTSITIFSDGFVVDSIGFVDKNYVNVNAHELAHQWFGDLVTETSGTHHWLQEGFATYYALLAERDIFGEDYYYWRLYEYAQELLDQERRGASTSLLNPKSSSTTFYKKGCLVLHILRDKVGDKAFRVAVKNYLKKHQFKNVETNDFIVEVEKASGKDLSQFVKEWLSEVRFNYEKVEEILYLSSTFVKQYIQIDCENYTSKCKDYLSSWISDEAKIKVIGQIPGHIKKKDFKNSIKVRQTIAKLLSKIPLELKEDYESLLDDKSYLTIEAALFGLWNNFPEDQSKYLQKTKDIQGFNDKNIRILWLTLALITGDFEPENETLYFNELESYTSPKYGFEIRQNAFSYLAWISSCGTRCQENLEQATKHHNWRFKKFAKELKKNINK
ncbi:M1 family metallopeptidase [Jejuia spongiicola]|uniref:Aminopeptidase N n=1 Tax=Jejuia spongiicola TaxID=2942207 RepID=A0ABT0QE80_9FLAO|nr:M1 family metallopeptidase [Jejuia spongiicola]MCL6295250.1 M1 family metallopeptidase [Jejuia spongiicola]